MANYDKTIFGDTLCKRSQVEGGVDKAQLISVTSSKDKSKYGGYTVMYSFDNLEGWTWDVNIGLEEAPVLVEMKELSAEMTGLAIEPKTDKKDLPANPEYTIELLAWGGKYDPLLWPVYLVRGANGYVVNYHDEKSEIDPQVIKKLLEVDFPEAVRLSKKI